MRRNVSDDLINFYEDRLSAKADMVFRVAFGLCLSVEGATEIVRKVYDELASRLEEYANFDDRKIDMLLVSSVWKQFSTLKGQKFSEGKSAVTQAIKPLSTDARLALMAVDIAGLDATEAATAIGWEEKKLRQKLAEGRGRLLKV